jgi:hypothetical protein
VGVSPTHPFNQKAGRFIPSGFFCDNSTSEISSQFALTPLQLQSSIFAGLHTRQSGVTNKCPVRRLGNNHPTPSTDENQRRKKRDQKAAYQNSQGKEAGEEGKEK